MANACPLMSNTPLQSVLASKQVFYCADCGHGSDTKTAHQSHRRKCPAKAHKCPFCHIGFSRKDNLKRHVLFYCTTRSPAKQQRQQVPHQGHKWPTSINWDCVEKDLNLSSDLSIAAASTRDGVMQVAASTSGTMTEAFSTRPATPLQPPRPFACPDAPRSKPSIETAPLLQLQPVDFAFGKSFEEWLGSCETGGGSGGGGNPSNGNGTGDFGCFDSAVDSSATWSESWLGTSYKAGGLSLKGDEWDEACDCDTNGGDWDAWLDAMLNDAGQEELARTHHDGSPSRKRRRLEA